MELNICYCSYITLNNANTLRCYSSLRASELFSVEKGFSAAVNYQFNFEPHLQFKTSCPILNKSIIKINRRADLCNLLI